MKFTVCVVVVLLACVVVRADDTYTLFNPTPSDKLRDMDTDRPDKTNSPHTVDPGHLQIESGLVDYVYDRNRYHGASARTDAWNFGAEEFRLGVLSNLELDLQFTAFEHLRNEDYLAHTVSRQNGIGDTTIGGLFNLWGDGGGDDVWATSLGIQPQFKIPTARENLGNGHGEFFLGVPFLITLPAGFHLNAETIGSWERNSTNTGQVLGWQNSVVVDHTIVGKLDAYVEYWSHVSTEHHAEAQQTIDIGATYPLTENLVIDSGFNFGLNRVSNNFEWTSGISVRF